MQEGPFPLSTGLLRSASPYINMLNLSNDNEYVMAIRQQSGEKEF